MSRVEEAMTGRMVSVTVEEMLARLPPVHSVALPLRATVHARYRNPLAQYEACLFISEQLR